MKDDINRLGGGEKAKQQYDISRMLESELTNINFSTAVFEIIDNALDETPKGENCEMVITFDEREERIVFANKNTSGMGPDKLQNFVQWGQEHTDPDKLKEHGQGGKLGILFMLSKETGSLLITSQAKESDHAYHMHLEKWWKNLAPGMEFEIKTIDADPENKKGFTRMMLDHVRPEVIPSRTQLAMLADRIGFSYAPLIRLRRLSLKLMRISAAGAIAQNYDVLPIDIPFEKDTVQVKKGVLIDRGKIKMDIKYGMIDVAQRIAQAAERKGYYDADKVFEPQGEEVRIFFGGKLLDERDLSEFVTGRAKRRMGLFNFAVVVNITEGFVEKTILKTALSKSSPKTVKIYEAISKTIEDYVTKLTKESETDEITHSEKKRVDEASTTLGTVLLKLHNSDLDKIREEFNLPTVTAPVSSTKEIQKDGKKFPVVGPKITTLPGTRGKGKQKEGKIAKVTRATNPIPTIEMAPTGMKYPNAILLKEEAGNRLVIQLNYDSPDVKLALRTRGALGIAQLVRIAAWAIYHEKWIVLFENNINDYLNGVQSDVADLLAKAEEFKIFKS